jgi:hypothetical protein
VIAHVQTDGLRIDLVSNATGIALSFRSDPDLGAWISFTAYRIDRETALKLSDALREAAEWGAR